MMTFALFSLLACHPDLEETGDSPHDTEDTGEDTSEDTSEDTAPTDADADGHGADVDCDDADPAVHPGATEVCDGVDQNCDGAADDGVSTTTWYEDDDDDGHGDDAQAVEACAAPAGHVDRGGDCDDADPTVLPGVHGCGVPLEATSCAEALSTGEASASGVYWIADASLPEGGAHVWCEMEVDGGGWIAVARALDEAYDPAPPPIGDGSNGTWAEWTAHAWRSGDSYYLPLDVFDALTDGATELMLMSRDSDGNVLAKLVYETYDYNATTNTSVLGACTDITGSACGAGYSWSNYPPGFNGWGRSDYCNAAYPTYIFNYHPETGCASSSGLFAYLAAPTARPQLLGEYTSVAHENLILVR